MLINNAPIANLAEFEYYQKKSFCLGGVFCYPKLFPMWYWGVKISKVSGDRLVTRIRCNDVSMEAFEVNGLVFYKTMAKKLFTLIYLVGKQAIFHIYFKPSS